MASRAEAGRALGIAAVSSVCGGVFSLVIFLLAAPLLARLATSFRPMEYFALAIFALSMLASISGKSSLRNLIAGAIGVLIGLFAMGELLNQSQTLDVVYKRISAVVVRLPSREDFRRIRGTILRSSCLGTFIGILPAEGATIAALMGYNEAKRWAKNKEEFGTGCPEGIAGPEAANNAATGGAMVPTLALGIPGSGTTAIILAALIMHGFRPGPFLMKETPEFVYAIFAAMLVANFMFLAIGLAGAKLFSRVTLIPRTLLWPSVFVFCLIGSYSAGASLFDVRVMLISGVVGFVMRRHGFSPAPLVMGLILGKLVEESLSQSMILLDSNWLRFFESPIVDMFFAFTVLGLTWPWLSALASSLWSRRKTAEAGDD